MAFRPEPKRFLRSRSLSRTHGSVKGQALVETVLILPLLLLILLGLIETGNGISIKHKMAVLSREGANIASRGSSLQETLDAMMDGGDDIGLRADGGAIVTRLVVAGGSPVIAAQLAYPGYESESRLGLPDSTAVPLEALPLVEGQVLYAVELLIEYKALTPFPAVLPGALTEKVYERAIF